LSPRKIHINIYTSFVLQQDRDRLLAEVENLAAGTDGQTHKSEDIYAQKLKALEAQVK
jgi:kinesin family protein 4/21/27